MLIDIHIHVAKKRHPKISRPKGDAYPTPDEALAMMDERDIDKAVVLSTVSPAWRYTVVTPEETLEICAAHPDRFIPFCNPRPLAISWPRCTPSSRRVKAPHPRWLARRWPSGFCPRAR